MRPPQPDGLVPPDPGRQKKPFMHSRALHRTVIHVSPYCLGPKDVRPERYPVG
jgi:hypothetical protein